MARIVLNNNNIARITNNVRRVYDKELYEAEIEHPEVWSDAIYNAIVPLEDQQIMAQLSPNYFKGIHELNVIVYGTGLPIKAKYSPPRLFPFMIKLNSLQVPLGTYGSPYSNNIIRLDSVVTAQIDKSVLDFIVQREEKIKAVKNKMLDAVNKVDMFLRQHGTLAPAIKEWPAIWNLIPLDMKETHTRVDDRKPREPKQETQKVDVDLSNVTARVIAARLKGEIK